MSHCSCDFYCSKSGLPRFVRHALAFVLTMAGAKPLHNRHTAPPLAFGGSRKPGAGAGSYRLARTCLDAPKGLQTRGSVWSRDDTRPQEGR
jgi:hypothetical protein